MSPSLIRLKNELRAKSSSLDSVINVKQIGCYEQYGFEQQERVSDERERVLQQKNWKYVLLTGLTVGQKLHAGKSYIYCVPYNNIIAIYFMQMCFSIIYIYLNNLINPPFLSTTKLKLRNFCLCRTLGFYRWILSAKI